MTAYPAFLAELYARRPLRTQLGLGRIDALLARLGRPQDAVPSVVVAGTNGKGSTSSLIAGALQAAGHRVGLFTSPHLLRFTERIVVDGKEISQAEVVALGEHIVATADRAQIDATFFEVTTALALLYFARTAVDIAVLEVGLGGRLDATNVAQKVLTVITPIACDHEALLGHTLQAIAAEKAAIMAPATPAVVAPQPAAAAAVVTAHAAAVGAPLYDAALGATWWTPDAQLPAYQRVNFATAQKACAVLQATGRFHCPPAAFAQAARAFTWPGRYQWLRPAGQWRRPLPCPLILDGGHNPAGAQALQAALAADPRVAGRPVHVIFAALQDKDATAMVAALRPTATSWRVCGVCSMRRRDPTAFAVLVGQNVGAFDHFAAAWADLTATQADAEAIILVTGSLFLVADALAHLTLQKRDDPIDG